VEVAVGSSWNGEGTILIGSGGNGPVARLSSLDGTTAPVTQPDPESGFTGDLMPWFLPDGRRFLYLRRSPKLERRGIYAGSIDVAPANQDLRQIVATPLGAIYVPANAGSGGGYLVFQRERTLLAQPFDAARLRLSGEAVRLADGVGYRLDSGFFAATPDVLVYRGDANPLVQLTWFGPDGKAVGVAGEPFEHLSTIGGVSIAPDGTRAAVLRIEQEHRDVWIVDFVRGASARLTLKGNVRAPVWSPDGSQVVFWSGRDATGLYRKRADGSEEEEQMMASLKPANPTSWSPDGRFVLFDIRDRNNSMDMWILSTGDRKPRLLLATDFNEGQGVFSPDGRWIAYLSNESGKEQVYVRGFRPDGSLEGKWLVSRGARSVSPRWRPDSKGLLYLSDDLHWMSVALSASGPGSLQAGPPAAFGELPPDSALGAFAPDGRRMLVPVTMSTAETAPFTVVVNWQSGLAAAR